MEDKNGTKDASFNHESDVSPDHHSLMGINVGGGGEQDHNHTNSSNAHCNFKWSEPRYVPFFYLIGIQDTLYLCTTHSSLSHSCYEYKIYFM